MTFHYDVGLYAWSKRVYRKVMEQNLLKEKDGYIDRLNLEDYH